MDRMERALQELLDAEDALAAAFTEVQKAVARQLVQRAQQRIERLER